MTATSRTLDRAEFCRRIKRDMIVKRKNTDLDHGRYRTMIEEQKRKGQWRRHK